MQLSSKNFNTVHTMFHHLLAVMHQSFFSKKARVITTETNLQYIKKNITSKQVLITEHKSWGVMTCV